jgi:hypothetical protein
MSRVPLLALRLVNQHKNCTALAHAILTVHAGNAIVVVTLWYCRRRPWSMAELFDAIQ